MELNNLGNNQTLVKLTNDKELFYSYKTIVSAKLKDKYYYLINYLKNLEILY